MSVAIIGVGLHPFGRFADMTAIDMGVVAIRRALADVGVEWRDIQFVFVGSYEVDNPDAVVGCRAHRHPVHRRVQRLRDGSERADARGHTIRLGEHGLGIAVGMDKHLPGVFTADPRLHVCPSRYGELGQFITTKFFGMKINKYMHDHGISHETLAKVVAKNLRNGVWNPNVFRRKPMAEQDILDSPMLNYPLTQYMFCSPDEGAAAVVLCDVEHVQPLHRPADLPEGDDGADPSSRRVRGAQPVAADRGDGRADGRRVVVPCTNIVGRPGGRRRDPAPGHRRGRRGDPPRRERASARTASRRSSSPRAWSRSTACCRSTPTAGSSPTASRSARRACARCTKWCCSSAGRPASARCRGARRWATRSCTACRAPRACRSCRVTCDRPLSPASPRGGRWPAR